MNESATAANAPDAHTPDQQEEAACFICAYANLRSQRCDIPVLEGQLISAYERNINGKWLPHIMLRSAHGLAEIIMTDYYRDFVKELVVRGKQQLLELKLTMRVYHLANPTSIENYNDELLFHYTGGPYTVAILEPDSLLNITDLSQASYCTRQYLLNRLVASPPSAATIRGNLVHHCFKELLKYHDRGALMQTGTQRADESPLAFMVKNLINELANSTTDLALAHLQAATLHDEVLPHLESLASWYQRERASLWDIPNSDDRDGYNGTNGTGMTSNNHVRAETFLLAPEIGLRGRLDLFWQQSGRQRLLELKTGGAKGDLPKVDHRWQVYGYHAQLAVRRTSKMKKAQATLVYSGTPGAAQAYGIPFTMRELHRVCAVRNLLVLSHVSGIAGAPPGPARCTRCAQLARCERASVALSWQLPQPNLKTDAQPSSPIPASDAAYSVPAPGRPHDSPEDRAFFATYYRLLTIEGREAERQQALLWHENVEERVQRGSAIANLRPRGGPQPNGRGEWLQSFACDNQSELRKGDQVLLSDGDPIRGEVVTGTITDIGADFVTVWTPELIDNPCLLDRYDSDQVHIRTQQNLMRWLDVDAHLRDLVAGRARPGFTRESVSPRPDFNEEQNLAVTRALQMQDYLLIQGPPGTGKTSVIAEIVKRLVQRGERVLLAAFTNQAVDNMLKRLAEKENFTNFVRLGHERSSDESNDIQDHLLQNLLKTHTLNGTAVENVAYQLLRSTPVVASTTATWSSERYTLTSQQDNDSPLHFDVAIIDEASQLTVPALLGALRFARRFILVGDEQQLPPLVLSKEAAQEGLADSLFAQLKRADHDYMKNHPEAVSACVSLWTQYRMNARIAHFASRVFYDDKLRHGDNNRAIALQVPSVGTWLRTEHAVITQALQPRYPLAFVDVQNQDLPPTHKSSQSEARAVKQLVKGLLARGVPPEDIGIIAPYRAQVATLRHLLFKDTEQVNMQQMDGLTIDTVDRFQGGERSVILISFATVREPQGELRDFLTNPNRLNVALTRAQRKLILVGHAPALEALPIFSRLLTYCRNMKTVFALNMDKWA